MKHRDSADNAPGRLPGPEVLAELEDRLRAAFRAKASDIRMPPRPLDLRRRRGAVRVVAKTRWVVAVAAAIAVLAIIAGALAVAGALPGPPAPPAGPIETSVPPYYVALLAGQPTPGQYFAAARATVAEVRATSTGREVASVTAPRPYAFVSVTAAADDRTFVLYAVGPSINGPANGRLHRSMRSAFSCCASTPRRSRLPPGLS